MVSHVSTTTRITCLQTARTFVATLGISRRRRRKASGRSRCALHAARSALREHARTVTVGQSFSFLALREIATALEQARRELSNGTLHPPQLPREE